MKSYIDEEATVYGKCKAACPKDSRAYSIEENAGKKVCTLKNLLTALAARCI